MPPPWNRRGHSRLQSVVIAAAATEAVEVQARILRVGPIKLALDQTRRPKTARKVLAEGIVRAQEWPRAGQTWPQRNRLASGKLARRLRDEAVRNLVDVGVELLQVHAVRSGIGHVDERIQPGNSRWMSKLYCSRYPYFCTV